MSRVEVTLQVPGYEQDMTIWLIKEISFERVPLVGETLMCHGSVNWKDDDLYPAVTQVKHHYTGKAVVTADRTPRRGDLAAITHKEQAREWLIKEARGYMHWGWFAGLYDCEDEGATVFSPEFVKEVDRHNTSLQ